MSDRRYKANLGRSQQPNRAARRREGVERRRRKEIWRRLVRQGGGTYTITIWRVGGPIPDGLSRAAIDQWVEAVAAGGLDALCLGCDRHPGVRPAAFSILQPFVDAPDAMSVTGVCRSCADRSDADLVALALAVMKRDVFHDLRPLNPAHMHGAGGRA
jgi:hypothetical protein